MIEVNHLTKKYGNHVAVDDVSFHLEEGHIYGFLGPNGAGKSTTMNIMTGYLASSKGEVLINGHNILKEAEEAKKCIGYLPEIPPVYENMTVKEYLKFVAELKQIPKKERMKQTEEVMELTKITDVENRLIQNLSKGYKQRVGIAQAVLGYPPIIILDEPTVGLDPKQIIEIRELIKTLGEKHTVILSSHILTEISAVCDYVLILSHGKLIASDTPQKLQEIFAGTNHLELTIKGAVGEVTTILSEIEEIQNCDVKADGEESLVKIDTSYNVDIREKLFYLFAEKKMPILGMALKSVTLEDVFLELTGAQEEEQLLEEADKQTDGEERIEDEGDL